LHDLEIADPYRWLEAASPERTEWIKAQNNYTDSWFKRNEGDPQLRARLEELLLVDTVDLQAVREGRIFLYRQKFDQQQGAIYMRDWLPEAEEKLLLNPNKLSEDGSVALGEISITKDGQIMAYGLTKNGSDWCQWKVMDIKTGDMLDEIPRLAYTRFSWLPDNSGFYYSRSEHTAPEKLTKTNKRLFFHRLGTDWRGDQLIFGEGLKEHESPYVDDISEDGRHVILGISRGYDQGELHYLDLLAKDGKIHPITEGAEGLFDSKIKNDVLYVLTNNKAPNFKICRSTLDGIPSIDRWETLIPEEKGRVLDSMSVFSDRLFVGEKRDIASHIKEYTLEGKFAHEIELPTLGCASVPYGKEEMNAVFLDFSSFFHPPSIYRYDFASRQLSLFAKEEYPFDPEMFMAEQVWFQSKDKTEVPMFVIRKKDTVLDGKNPTILTGYGGFNIGMEPEFSPSGVGWLEKGGIVAIANLRGGDEFGEDWHKAGMLGNKQNVFDDFISAGEALTGDNPSRLAGDDRYAPRKYTSPHNLGIQGGSNGGLLVGAALVQRPDLWGAVNCDVPLLDMLRFHLTEGGKYWKSEYGDPDDPDDFRFLLAYSPYHNAKDGVEYPPVLFETSLGDDRGVDPMHAMKMAAMLQAYNTSDNPILLRVKTNTGHGHSKPIKMIIDELVEYYSFMHENLKD
jgi:prolyl oligopeptidase